MYGERCTVYTVYGLHKAQIVYIRGDATFVRATMGEVVAQPRDVRKCLENHATQKPDSPTLPYGVLMDVDITAKDVRNPVQLWERMLVTFNDCDVGSTYQQLLKKKGLSHTSMSVGGVIAFPDGQFYYCCRIGWQLLPQLRQQPFPRWKAVNFSGGRSGRLIRLRDFHPS